MLAVVLAAAVTAAQLQALQANDQRVRDIGYRLSTRGVAHCPGGTAPQYGLRVHVRGQYPKRDWPVLKEVLYLDDEPGVLAVATDGPVAKAGIRAGDVLYSIDDTEFVGSGNEGYPAVARVEAALAAPRVRMYLWMRARVIVTGVPGCASTVELIPSNKLNAKADGRIVQLTTGVLEQTRDDDELAFVVAHEMAHNILKHPRVEPRDGEGGGRARAHADESRGLRSARRRAFLGAVRGEDRRRHIFGRHPHAHQAARRFPPFRSA